MPTSRLQYNIDAEKPRHELSSRRRQKSFRRIPNEFTARRATRLFAHGVGMVDEYPSITFTDNADPVVLRRHPSSPA